MTPKRRIVGFILICALCVLVSVGYVWMRVRQIGTMPGDAEPASGSAVLGETQVPASPPVSSSGASGMEPEAASRAALPNSPYVVFRTTVLGPDYGQLVTVRLDESSPPRVPTGLRCERAYFSGGYGVCLTADRRVITAYHAYIFDRSLRPLHRLPLKGIPSRTRLSPDGRHAAITVFVSGHTYAPGSFSTHTEIFRTADGSSVAELEQFAVERDGKPFREIDFNFWGVTFAGDGNHFYATLATRGQNYLVEGDLDARRARVLHAGVECPSLSPDGRRIAFKHLTKAGWRLQVIDLATGAETPLAEERSVDDQAEWLDDERVLYALENDIWVVPADGAGTPSVFLANAYSPAIVRP